MSMTFSVGTPAIVFSGETDRAEEDCGGHEPHGAMPTGDPCLGAKPIQSNAGHLVETRRKGILAHRVLA
jgi:hypothetical protein